MILGDLSVRWDLLADAAKAPLVWKAIARQMGPQALRMNLNTLLRREVLSNGKAGRRLEPASEAAPYLALSNGSHSVQF